LGTKDLRPLFVENAKKPQSLSLRLYPPRGGKESAPKGPHWGGKAPKLLWERSFPHKGGENPQKIWEDPPKKAPPKGGPPKKIPPPLGGGGASLTGRESPLF